MKSLHTRGRILPTFFRFGRGAPAGASERSCPEIYLSYYHRISKPPARGRTDSQTRRRLFAATTFDPSTVCRSDDSSLVQYLQMMSDSTGAERQRYIDFGHPEHQAPFAKDNSVKTSRYTIFSFLPLVRCRAHIRCRPFLDVLLKLINADSFRRYENNSEGTGMSTSWSLASSCFLGTTRQCSIQLCRRGPRWDRLLWLCQCL